MWRKARCNFSELWTIGVMSPHCLKSFLVPILGFPLLPSYSSTYCTRCAKRRFFTPVVSKAEFTSRCFAANTKIVMCHFICILTGLEKMKCCIYLLFSLFLTFANHRQQLVVWNSTFVSCGKQTSCVHCWLGTAQNYFFSPIYLLCWSYCISLIQQQIGYS